MSMFQDDGDEYVYREDQDQFDDDEFMQDGPSTGRRRSTRSTRTSGNGYSAVDEWRGERRSTRLGANTDMQLDQPPPKRARTVDSTSSGELQPSTSSAKNTLKIKVSGAAAIKPTETAVEAIAGKKKSKFWFYAVEPISGPPVAPAEPALASVGDVDMTNGHDGRNGTGSITDDGDVEVPPPSESNTNGDPTERSLERSLSPTSNMDES